MAHVRCLNDRARKGNPVIRTDVSQLDEESRLFAELYGPLRRFAAVVGPAEVDPDDLLQEAVARVLRRGHLTDLDQPAAYLRKTMLNLASNSRRKFARERRALVRLGPASLPTSDVYPSDLDELRSLSPRERAVLYLSEVEGYRYAEVGDLLGCTEAAARKQAMRARRHLYAQVIGEATDG
jgi:RNA polymerase sigma-70 factor (ECF subfamily)